MARVEKTVFISYRRTDGAWALTVYNWLTQHGYDAFIDYEGIGPGAFESVIIDNILARAHFLVILSPTALDRCNKPGDWLRREIETAMASGRNVVPLMVDGFTFGDPKVSAALTGSLEPLAAYNGLDISVGTFADKMNRLSTKFLSVALEAVLHPPSVKASQAAREQKLAADAAAQLASPPSRVPHFPQPTASKNSSRTVDGLASGRSSKRLHLALAFVFGAVFATLFLYLLTRIGEVSPLALRVYLVLLATSAAGLGALTPGLLGLQRGSLPAAGSALGLFALVYLTVPSIVAPPEANIAGQEAAALAACVAAKTTEYEAEKSGSTEGGASAAAPGAGGGTKTDVRTICYSVGPDQQIVTATTTTLSCHGGRCSVTAPAYDDDRRRVCVTATAWSESKSFGGGGSGKYRLNVTYKSVASPDVVSRFEAACRVTR